MKAPQIRDLAREAGLSAEQLAEATGLEARSMQAWLREPTQLPDGAVRDIWWRAFHTRRDQLLSETGTPTECAAVKELGKGPRALLEHRKACETCRRIAEVRAGLGGPPLSEDFVFRWFMRAAGLSVRLPRLLRWVAMPFVAATVATMTFPLVLAPEPNGGTKTSGVSPLAAAGGCGVAIALACLPLGIVATVVSDVLGLTAADTIRSALTPGTLAAVGVAAAAATLVSRVLTGLVGTGTPALLMTSLVSGLCAAIVLVAAASGYPRVLDLQTVLRVARATAIVFPLIFLVALSGRNGRRDLRRNRRSHLTSTTKCNTRVERDYC